MEEESLPDESVGESGTEAGNCNWHGGITQEDFPFSLRV